MAVQKCVKVPVVLGSGVTQHLICTEVPLRPPAFEIKDTTKRVDVTQCKVGGVVTSDDRCIAKVIIDAVLRKNINFKTAERDHESDHGLQGGLESRVVCGVLRHCFVKQLPRLHPRLQVRFRHGSLRPVRRSSRVGQDLPEQLAQHLNHEFGRRFIWKPLRQDPPFDAVVLIVLAVIDFPVIDFSPAAALFARGRFGHGINPLRGLDRDQPMYAPRPFRPVPDERRPCCPHHRPGVAVTRKAEWDSRYARCPFATF